MNEVPEEGGIISAIVMGSQVVKKGFKTCNDWVQCRERLKFVHDRARAASSNGW